MTDRNQATEYIHNATQAFEIALEASKGVREKANIESYEQFHNHMQELTVHLKNLEIYLEHPEVYDFDELAEWINKTFEGKYKEYHHLTHI